MSRGGGDYRGPLAGVGAGAMGVLVVLVLLLLAWHRIAGAVGTAATVILIAVTVMVCAVAVYVLGRLGVLLLLHVQQPDTARFTVRARPPVSGPPMQALPSSAGELPAPGGVHYHFHAADAVMDSLETGYRGLPDREGR
jgi:hypothetical protein